MALDVEEEGQDGSKTAPNSGTSGNMEAHSDEEEEEDDDDEPRLKYASLTKIQASVYRNGDATSAFMVAGDKMV